MANRCPSHTASLSPCSYPDCGGRCSHNSQSKLHAKQKSLTVRSILVARAAPPPRATEFGIRDVHHVTSHAPCHVTQHGHGGPRPRRRGAGPCTTPHPPAPTPP